MTQAWEAAAPCPPRRCTQQAPDLARRRGQREPSTRPALAAAQCFVNRFTKGVFRSGKTALGEAAAQRSKLTVATALPRREPSTQGPAAVVSARDSGVSQRQAEWVRGGPVGFTQWESAFLRRVRPSHAGAPGQEALMQAGPPTREAVRPGPFRQLAGHRGRKGLRKKHRRIDSAVLSSCSPLQKRDKKASPWSSSLRQSGPGLGSYLVVGDRFLLSQWTASKKAAFQNLSVCLQDRQRPMCLYPKWSWLLPHPAKCPEDICASLPGLSLDSSGQRGSRHLQDVGEGHFPFSVSA